jgi:hypothetical protein
MALKNYTTKEDIENYILNDIDNSFDDQLDSWMEGVERIIDNLTGRNFKADSTASARVFDGDGTNELLVDDCIQVTVVEVGNDDYGGNFSTVPSSGSDRFFLEPANYSVRGVPITKVSLSARAFPSGIQNNRITAKWGYSASVPKDINFVATVFVAGILNQQRQGGDQIKSEKIGNYQVTYNTDNGADSWSDFEKAKEILNSYKKYYL